MLPHERCLFFPRHTIYVIIQSQGHQAWSFLFVFDFRRTSPFVLKERFLAFYLSWSIPPSEFHFVKGVGGESFARENLFSNDRWRLVLLSVLMGFFNCNLNTVILKYWYLKMTNDEWLLNFIFTINCSKSNFDTFELNNFFNST